MILDWVKKTKFPYVEFYKEQSPDILSQSIFTLFVFLKNKKAKYNSIDITANILNNTDVSLLNGRLKIGKINYSYDVFLTKDNKSFVLIDDQLFDLSLGNTLLLKPLKKRNFILKQIVLHTFIIIAYSLTYADEISEILVV